MCRLSITPFIITGQSLILQVSSAVHSSFLPPAVSFDKQACFQHRGLSSKPPYSSYWDLFSRYALSKLALILSAAALQRRHPNIICASCDPGGAKTTGALSIWPAFLRPVMGLLYPSPAAGARPVLFLAAGRDVAADRGRYKGAYVGNKCKILPPSQLAQNLEVAENLWKSSEEALAPWIAA